MFNFLAHRKKRSVPLFWECSNFSRSVTNVLSRLFWVEFGQKTLFCVWSWKWSRSGPEKTLLFDILDLKMVEKWYKKRSSLVLWGLKWSKSGTKKRFFFVVLELKVVSIWSEIQFSRTSYNYCKQSSRDPQTKCERLTRDRSLVLHARLVLLQVLKTYSSFL